MGRRLTSLEVCLCVITFLLTLCCVGLIVVFCINLKHEGNNDHRHSQLVSVRLSPFSVLLSCLCAGADKSVVLSGQIKITQGAEFSEELKNLSSLPFKSLSFDVQNLVRSHAFILKLVGKLLITSFYYER